jgi:hypothetical protein
MTDVDFQPVPGPAPDAVVRQLDNRSTRRVAWCATTERGSRGARFGLLMAGVPLVNGRYYQEVAPRVAMDRAQILSVDGTLTVPAGRFVNVVKTEETTPLVPRERGYKYYAPGVGLIQSGSLKLVRYGKARAPQQDG